MNRFLKEALRGVALVGVLAACAAPAARPAVAPTMVENNTPLTIKVPESCAPDENVAMALCVYPLNPKLEGSSVGGSFPDCGLTGIGLLTNFTDCGDKANKYHGEYDVYAQVNLACGKGDEAANYRFFTDDGHNGVHTFVGMREFWLKHGEEGREIQLVDKKGQVIGTRSFGMGEWRFGVEEPWVGATCASPTQGFLQPKN